MAQDKNQPTTSRRDFLATTTAAGAAALAANLGAFRNVHAGGNDMLRVGLVGCGGRGSGAAKDCVLGGENVRLVAMGDAFQNRLDQALTRFNNDAQMRGKFDVPRERRFVGLDAYQRVIDACDLVILATPPGFRPTHLAAAVRAGKHIFTEKPVAVDGPGIRQALQAYEEATRRRLCIVAGTQRRYQTGYLESMRRIHNGDIGDLTSARCFWNMGGLWHAARTDGMSDLEWQIRNWLYFTWLSGDHIVEQHVHNLDVVNWATRAHPIKASGVGGRQVRTGPEYGHIYDHFAIDFEYPNGFHCLSMCRQFPTLRENQNVSESLVGTRGKWYSPQSATRGRYVMNGAQEWTMAGREDNNPYRQEHVVLIQRIRQGEPINDLQNVAHSTLTAIMGRMACYTGLEVSWEQAMQSQERLVPERLDWNGEYPVPAVAMPGRTQLR